MYETHSEGMTSFNKAIRVVLSVIAPPPNLTMSQWADKYRRLSAESSAEPGKWNTDRFPPMRGIMDAISDPKNHEIVCMKSSQVGWALSLDTPIFTTHGWETMGSLSVGDIVFDEKGQQCAVKFKSEVYTDHVCYDVKFSDGSTITADESHRWYVESITNLRDITDGRYHYRQRNGVVTTREMVNNVKCHGNRNRFAIPVTTPLIMCDVDLPIDPYWLGVWLGDGSSSSGQVSCYVDDVAELVNNARRDGLQPTTSVDPRTGVYAVNLLPREKVGVGSTFYNMLNSTGVLFRKHVPNEYITSSYHQRMQLIRGLMDTDGTITKNGRCEFYNTNRGLIESMFTLLASVGLKPKIRERVNGDILPRCTKPCNVKLLYCINFLAYDNQPVFRMERKLNRMKSPERESETKRRRIVSVMKVKSVPVQCIEVDSQSHLFLAGKSMIPTHNTEVINNTVGYYAHQDPSNMLIIQPTVEMAEVWSKDRLAPMIRDTPVLIDRFGDPRVRDGSSTLRHKQFTGGQLAMAGANSPASLASRPVRLALFDEVDRFPVSAGAEGDPVLLGKKRTQTYWNKKILCGGTPTIKNHSVIERMFHSTNQRRCFVPCPHCNHMQHLVWSNLQFDPESRDVPAQYMCKECACLIPHTKKLWMLKRHEWRDTATGGAKGVVGFHINELYSVWSSWDFMRDNFLEAKKSKETLKTFVNTSLGETWEEEGEKLSGDDLYKRRETYTKVPDLAVCLTAGVDVQDDRIEIQVVAWSAKEECHIIDYLVVMGNPVQEDIWVETERALRTTYEREDGNHMSIVATGVDTGGHHTTRTYKFCHGLESIRVLALKGHSMPGKPIIGRPKRLHNPPVNLYIVGVDTVKDMLFARLELTEGDYSIHFPWHFDPEYFAQLTAEKRVTAYKNGIPYTKYIKERPRNEALDTWVYARAALSAVNIDLDNAKPLVVMDDAKVSNATTVNIGGGFIPKRESPWFKRS